MIITVDIGNTNVTVGGFREGQEPDFVERVPSLRNCSERHWLEVFRGILSPCVSEVEGCALSSVVPELTGPVLFALKRLTEQPVVTVDADFDDGLILAGYDRKRLGNDRVVDAVAALAQYPAPLAIFDLGTATTLSVLDAEGRLIGGMILPGLRLSVSALSARAAQLPEIDLEAPQSLLGTDTVSCMQSGAVYGAAAQVDGLRERVEDLLGRPVTAVVTGGASHLVLPYCKHPVCYDEYLLLKGLRLLYKREQMKGQR